MSCDLSTNGELLNQTGVGMAQEVELNGVMSSVQNSCSSEMASKRAENFAPIDSNIPTTVQDDGTQVDLVSNQRQEKGQAHQSGVIPSVQNSYLPVMVLDRAKTVASIVSNIPTAVQEDQVQVSLMRSQRQRRARKFNLYWLPKLVAKERQEGN